MEGYTRFEAQCLRTDLTTTSTSVPTDKSALLTYIRKTSGAEIIDLEGGDLGPLRGPATDMTAFSKESAA